MCLDFTTFVKSLGFNKSGNQNEEKSRAVNCLPGLLFLIIGNERLICFSFCSSSHCNAILSLSSPWQIKDVSVVLTEGDSGSCRCQSAPALLKFAQKQWGGGVLCGSWQLNSPPRSLIGRAARWLTVNALCVWAPRKLPVKVFYRLLQQTSTRRLLLHFPLEAAGCPGYGKVAAQRENYLYSEGRRIASIFSWSASWEMEICHK